MNLKKFLLMIFLKFSFCIITIMFIGMIFYSYFFIKIWFGAVCFFLGWIWIMLLDVFVYIHNKIKNMKEK